MAKRDDLTQWVLDALRDLGGSGSVVEVCRSIWSAHEHDLSSSGDLFYTWQYDTRWAAQKLRDSGALAPSSGRGRASQWMLAPALLSQPTAGEVARLAQFDVEGHILLHKALRSKHLSRTVLRAAIGLLKDDSFWGGSGRRAAVGGAVIANPGLSVAEALHLVELGAAFAGDLVGSRPGVSAYDVQRLVELEDLEGSSQWTDEAAETITRFDVTAIREIAAAVAARNDRAGWIPHFVSGLVVWAEDVEVETLLLPVLVDAVGLSDNDAELGDFALTVSVMKRNRAAAQAVLSDEAVAHALHAAGFDFDSGGTLLAGPPLSPDLPVRPSKALRRTQEAADAKLNDLVHELNSRDSDEATARQALVDALSRTSLTS